ncbi:MAG TPA: acetate/propionate family kinase [Candidatus Binataceae bacterium]|nr:acetate/propionate family kinase [Candidatus Binataceae bacterium]
MPDLNIAPVVLCLNSGSSSRKVALFRFGPGGEELLATGAAEGIGLDAGRLWLRDGRDRLLCDGERHFPRPEAAMRGLFDEIDRQRLPRPDAIGHRFVHGGPNHFAPERITDPLRQELSSLIAFAPLHIPDEMQGVEIAVSRFPGLPQVACFDTYFHRQMPEMARRFALPRTLWDEGILRYGFHGISYEYIMQTLGAGAPDRIIIAHLGNGASMAAVRGRRAIDTTMGFTPAGGFMMGTRSGDLDPGILIYLAREKNYDGSRLEQLVNHQSGLLGVSQVSSDMRMLLETRTSNPDAALAVEMFCYQARKCVGALAAALGGLDLLVFTAGIGERAAPVRREICRGLEYLGIELDDRLNDSHCDVISSSGSRCVVRVIPANEDLMIARHTRRTIFGNASK